MAKQLRELSVLGVYPVHLSNEEFDEAVEILWGTELSGKMLEAAQRSVKEHFDGLCLIEIQVEPPDAELNWGELTQPIDGQPKSNWQAPYDEQLVDQQSGRWAFFLHSVDLKKPLSTPLGVRPLPEPSPLPHHLKTIKYELP